jgi:hypothetical protein
MRQGKMARGPRSGTLVRRTQHADMVKLKTGVAISFCEPHSP